MGQCGHNFPGVRSPKIGIGLGPHQTYDKIAEFIAYSLQNEPTDESNKELYELLTGKSNNYQQYLLSNHLFSGIFWSLGLLLILTLIILFVLTAIWQCCSSCRPNDSKKTKKSGIFLIIFSSIALFFLLVGFFEFNQNQKSTTNAFELLYDNENDIAKDTENFLLSGLKETKCEVGSFFDKMSDQLKIEIPLMIEEIKKQSGFQVLLEFNNNNINIQKPAKPQHLLFPCDAVYDGIENKLGEVKTKFDDLSTTLNTANNRLILYQDDIQKTINKELQKQKEAFLKTLNKDNEITNEIESIKNVILREHDKIKQNPNYESVQTYISMIYNIPVITAVIFATFSIISLMLSSKSHDKCSSALIMLVFYITSVFAIVIILMFCISFIAGWAFATICVSNYHNMDHTLLKNVETEIEIAPGHPVTLNAQNILKTCSDPRKTLFSLVDIRPLIQTNIIDPNMFDPNMFANAQSQIQQLGNQIKTEDLKKAIKSAEEEKKNSQQLMTGCETQLAEQMSFVNKTTHRMQKMVELAEKIRVNVDVALIANNKFKPMIEYEIETFIIRLEKDVFKCKPIYEIYRNIETSVCQGLGRPIHGLWSSAGLSGLSMFLLAILFLLAYRWLNKGHQSQVTLNGI